MTETALDRFWELIFGAIALNPKAFELIQTLPQSNRVALYTLLLAGFSQAIGQAIVLFVNRVKPIRFILSLLIASVLFAFSIGFWGLSTWLVSRILFDDNVSFGSVWSAMGLAYAPLIFSFFIALPYLGVPILVLLSIWTLLAFVIGLRVALDLSAWQAFWCVALGWVIFQILERTIGRPIAAIGKWLSNKAAGTQLVTDMRGLEQLLQTGPQISPGIYRTGNKAGNNTDKG
ncbi:YIP1 family protein [Fischerella sp. PCC 9605]|uniref:YIP1 family protein n=1 Tax=Fischerella sp. PCC 9605 TaxID=1173024 RepID=UPI00047CF275|nr:YIP1 family protein [Fischerella sp. PCC 9605]